MTTITPLPTPVPTRSDPSNFSDRADDFLSALPTFATEANLVASEVNTNASNAATSASTATTQAGVATTQAGIATTQAGIATSAAAEAEGLVQNYQGSLASDPSLNKDGGPLSAGDWYINSTTGFIRAYNGSVWVQGISDVAGVTSVNGLNGALVSKDVVPSITANAGKVLRVNSGSTDVEWGIGLAEGYQEFTTSGTWTKPSEATWVYVECIGGGGSGGVQNSSTPVACGGGGGNCVTRIFRAVDVSATEAVVVGAGGSAVSVVTGIGNASGNSGGSSSFGSLIVSGGGGGGLATTNRATLGGDGIGFSTSSDTDGNSKQGTYSCGAGGGHGKFGGNCVTGGAGGGGAGRAGGVSVLGGDGGAGVSVNSSGANTTATSGSYPGGGGGGAVNASTTAGTTTSGAGANGRVRVWWW